MGPHRLHRERGRGRSRAAARASDEETVMSARESSASRPSFGASLGMGLVLSLCGAAVLSVLAPVMVAGFALRAVTAMVAFAYVLYLIGKSGERVGRVATVVCWLVVAAGAHVAGLPL